MIKFSKNELKLFQSEKKLTVIIMFLFGRSRSTRLFGMFFSISVALSLGAVLRLSNITPGGSEARAVRGNTRWKLDNKKKL